MINYLQMDPAISDGQYRIGGNVCKSSRLSDIDNSAKEHMARHKMLLNCPQKSLLPSKMPYIASDADILSDSVLICPGKCLLVGFLEQKAVLSPAYRTLF